MQKFKAEKQYFHDPFHPFIMFLSNFTKSKQVYNVKWLQNQTKASVGDSDCHKRNMWPCLMEIKILHAVNIGQALFTVLIQSLCCVCLFVTPWTAACQVSLSVAISWSLLRLMSIESVMPANHLVLCCPFHFLPSIFPSIRVFSNELTLCISESKYWSFSISPSNEYSWLIFFRIDWLELFAVQGTVKSLLQQHSSKATILQHSIFFMFQISHPCITTRKTIALTIHFCWQRNVSAF